MKRLILCAVVVLCGVGQVRAAIIDFENFAPPGGYGGNVSPDSPYVEDGFTITPTDRWVSVFDSAWEEGTMVGNDTDWLGFARTNTLTLTSSSGPFNLVSLLAGPDSRAEETTIDITISGHTLHGGTIRTTVPDLSTATLVELNLPNLESVEFSANDAAALDNIHAVVIPEPSTLILLLTALTFATVRRWRHRQLSEHRR